MAGNQLDNPTGIAEIDAVLKGLSKNFNIDFSPQNYGNIVPIPSGSLALDIWSKIGGLPDSRIIEIIGDPGSMKTSLALAIIASRQAWRKANGITGKLDLIIDLEHTLTESFILSFGIDMSQVFWKRFMSVEPAMQLAIDLPKTGLIHTVVYDSVDANETALQMQKAAGESVVGGASKIMSESLRTISKICEEFNTQYLFINQWRSKIGVIMGNPNTPSGGNALPYYATMRLNALKDNKGHPDVPGAALFRLKCIKTKCSEPINEPLQVAFIYGRGFDKVSDIETVAKGLEILRHSGGQTKVLWTADSEWEPLHPDIDKGKQAALDFLRENPLYLERLEAACLRLSNLQAHDDQYYLDLINKQVAHATSDLVTDK